MDDNDKKSPRHKGPGKSGPRAAGPRRDGAAGKGGKPSFGRQETLFAAWRPAGSG